MLVGGVLLFTGDMLFYFDGDSTNLVYNMGNASDIRIITSGITALLATWFYLFGLGQVYYAFKSAKLSVQNQLELETATALASTTNNI